MEVWRRSTCKHENGICFTYMLIKVYKEVLPNSIVVVQLDGTEVNGGSNFLKMICGALSLRSGLAGANAPDVKLHRGGST